MSFGFGTSALKNRLFTLVVLANRTCGVGGLSCYDVWRRPYVISTAFGPMVIGWLDLHEKGTHTYLYICLFVFLHVLMCTFVFMHAVGIHA